MILDAGNLLFKQTNLSPGTPTEIAKKTAEIIISGFNGITCNAFTPGVKDFAAGLSFVQNMQKKANFPFISANIQDINGNRIFDPYIIIDIENISIGIIGLSSSFTHSDVLVHDPIQILSEIIFEVSAQSDITILLFDSEESDISKIYASNFPIDLIIRSRSKLQSQDGGNKNIPIYSCGERGKYLYQFDLNIVDPSSKFTDLAFYEKKISRAQKKLNKMKQGNLVVELETMYKDDPVSLKKIENYNKEILTSKQNISNSQNTIKLTKHSLDKTISDHPYILEIVDSGKKEREDLFGPLPPSTPPGHNHKHIRHDHDGDGIPDH